jgi:drug/metabolite transporter (DMT)-like permease
MASLSFFVVGAGALALWIDMRFPRLAPQSHWRRIAAALFACVFLHASFLGNSSTAVAYATLFGVVLPAFVAVFLTAAWLIRALNDVRQI